MDLPRKSGGKDGNLRETVPAFGFQTEEPFTRSGNRYLLSLIAYRYLFFGVYSFIFSVTFDLTLTAIKITNQRCLVIL